MSAQISLCIVARNEALVLGDALASAQPVVDEIVVVDTGSGDATVKIARAAGARVVETDWPGDLGSAHALPVAHARGDWVLALDADEVLDPGSRHRIRELVSSDRFDGYELPVRNYDYEWRAPKWRPADPRDPLTRGAAGYTPTNPVRLFRRRREYAYVGRVHQTVKPSIAASGGRVGRADVPIHHYGFLRTDRYKGDLYVSLARRYAAERPEDPQAWIDLGVVMDSRPASADAFRMARSLGELADASYHLGCVLLELGQVEESIRLFSESIRNNPDDEACFYDRADSWDALGRAYEELGASDEAERAFRTALRLAPGHPAAAVNLAGHLADGGELDEAERLLEPLLARNRGSAEVWSTLGVLRLRRRDNDGARRALETALDIRPENLAALANLALLYRRAARRDTSARLYSAVGEQLGSEQAARLGLEAHIPARYRRPPTRRAGAGGGVVSVIATLGGGAGRVLVDAALALEGRAQHVLCGQPQESTGEGLREELERAGIDVLVVSSDAEIVPLLRQLRPSVVIHHWSMQRLLPEAYRVDREKWVCVGHGPVPMPSGYDRYVVVSGYQRPYQQHLPRELVSHIPNGVDLSRFERQGQVRGDGPVTIAMVSRLGAGKFPRRLLAYLPPLDDVQVLVAGYGARRHELEPEVAGRGLEERVRFVGPLASAEVPGFLSEADIGLHLNEMAVESCPLAVLEMMAAGLPVVAQPRGGLIELVEPGRNGFLETNEAQIAGRLAELIGSTALRARMGAESRHIARSFDMARFRSSVQDLIACVERERPRTRAGDGAIAVPAPASWVPRLSYVVCASPLAGERLLCDALTSTGLAGHPGEHLRVLTTGMPAGFDLRVYLQDVIERTATPNGVFGTALMSDQLPVLLERLGPRPTGAFANLRYIRLRRRDRLRHAISLELAHQTGVWEPCRNPLPVEVSPPRFDRAAVEARMREIDQDEARLEELLAAAGAQPIEVVYEELLDARESTVRRVLAELGIEVPPSLALTPHEPASEAGSVTDDWVERYSEPDSFDRAPVKG